MKQNQILEKLTKLENILTKKNDNAFRPTSKPLSFKEAAAYLGFKPSYLYKITHKKLITFYKPSGKMLFFSKSDLDNWVFAKSKDPAKCGVNESGKLKGKKRNAPLAESDN